MQSDIETKLTESFKLHYLSVINESHQHRSGKGHNSHFKVIIVSEDFEGMALLQRHRRVNQALGTIMTPSNMAIHALALHVFTPQEWQLQSLDSPTCANRR